jgi:Tol biopolymer transport system component
LWLLSASSVLVAIILAVLYFAQTSVQVRPVRFVIPPPEGTTLSGSLAVSPDGKQLAFAATGRDGITALWVRPFGSLDAYKLPETEGAAHPFWSSDNRFVGFFAGRKLKKIRVEGGPPQILCEVFDARGGTWNRDGVIVFSPNVGSPLYRIDGNGGAPVPVTALDQERQESSHQWPQFLQDGRHFLYLVSSEQVQARGIYVGSLDSTETKHLLESDRSVAFAQGESDLGYLLFLRGRTLMGQRFDPGAPTVIGEAFPIADQLWYDGTTPGLAAFAVSEDGVVAFRSGGVRNTQLRWFDRAGNPLEAVGPPGTYRDHSLAPDEETVAVARMDPETGTHDVWLFELSRGTASRLTFYPGEENTPTWAPDGGQIVFSSNQQGQPNLYLKAANGSRSEEELLPSDVSKYPTDWSADGSHLVYAKWDPKTSWDLWLLPMTGERKPISYLQSEFDTFQAQFSPDGRWIAYTSNESGEYQVYVQPFPMRDGKRQISTSGGAQPQWRRDGRELFYLARDGTLMAVEARSGVRFEPGVPKPLFRTQVTGLTNARNHYVSSADGQRFLVNTIIEEGASSHVTVLFGSAAWLAR